MSKPKAILDIYLRINTPFILINTQAFTISKYAGKSGDTYIDTDPDEEVTLGEINYYNVIAERIAESLNRYIAKLEPEGISQISVTPKSEVLVIVTNPDYDSTKIKLELYCDEVQNMVNEIVRPFLEELALP